MGSSRQRCAALVLALVAVCCGPAATGAFGFGDSGGSLSVPNTAAVKTDVKYIKCEICQLLAKQAYRQAKAAEKALKPGKKLSEYALIELLEKITNPLKDEGEWLARLDLVEEGARLAVREQEQLGRCGAECKTAQRAAEEVLDGIDTDAAEQLWKGSLSRAQFSNWLCQEATRACRGKAPPLPAGRPKGPEFEPLDPEEAKMQKMMASMKEMGMGGQMFSREQAQRMADGGGGGDEYDDYGDDSNPTGGSNDSPFGQEDEADGAAGSGGGGVWDSLSSLGQEAARKGGELASGLLSKAQGLLPGGKAPSQPSAEL